MSSRGTCAAIGLAAGRADLESQFGRSAQNIATQSACIDLKSASRWAQLTIWESVVAELEVNDISSVDLVFSRSDEVRSTEFLEELIVVLVEQVLTDGS
jgi:hypothetical protein